MAHGPQNFELSSSCCIYCRRNNVKLTDEHIVPLGLGGVHVLKKASCLDCNKITGRFEQQVLRGLWGDARISYAAPTRRKRERLRSKIENNHPILSSMDIDAGEFPAPMVFYKMGKAGFLRGINKALDQSPLWTMVAIHDNARFDAWMEKYGEAPVGKFRHVPTDFARMIVKIGYCQVLTSFGVDDFSPICLDYILGNDQNISYVVGENLHLDSPKLDIGYNLETMGVGTLSRLILLANVRLMANNHTPTYHVVVGEIYGELAIQRALSMIPYINVSSLGQQASPNLPDVWPLPVFENERYQDRLPK